MNSFKEKSWSRIGELLFLTESKFLFHPTRIETNSIIITDAGEKEEKMGIDFIYSISELESMLNKTGFQLKEIYSIPGKRVYKQKVDCPETVRWFLQRIWKFLFGRFGHWTISDCEECSESVSINFLKQNYCCIAYSTRAKLPDISIMVFTDAIVNFSFIIE